MSVKELWHKSLEYFGLIDEDELYDEGDEINGVPPEERPVVQGIREGRPKRHRDEHYRSLYKNEEQRTKSSVIRPLTTPQVKVHLLAPRSFNDAQIIGDKFKVNIPVILNLQSSDPELSKRLIDFASGLTYALDGGMQRVAERVFLLTPSNVEVSAEERQRLIEKGFFNQL